MKLKSKQLEKIQKTELEKQTKVAKQLEETIESVFKDKTKFQKSKI